MQVLSFGSTSRDGRVPEWHRMTDVVTEIDMDVVERCERFIWEILISIDGR
jgi:hypothetical protein